MQINIRKYESNDSLACRAIWNHVVKEGNAFPQEQGLSEEEADVFFKSQTYTGVAEDLESVSDIVLMMKNGQVTDRRILNRNQDKTN